MVGIPDRGNTYFRYSDVIKSVCEVYCNSEFSFKDLNSLTKDYNSSVHKCFSYRGLIIKTRLEYVLHKQNYTSKGTKCGNSYIRVQYYKFSNDLKLWYLETYVYCNGNGVIARKNRDKMRSALTACQVSTS